MYPTLPDVFSHLCRSNVSSSARHTFLRRRRALVSFLSSSGRLVLTSFTPCFTHSCWSSASFLHSTAGTLQPLPSNGAIFRMSSTLSAGLSSVTSNAFAFCIGVYPLPSPSTLAPSSSSVSPFPPWASAAAEASQRGDWLVTSRRPFVAGTYSQSAYVSQHASSTTNSQSLCSSSHFRIAASCFSCSSPAPATTWGCSARKRATSCSRSISSVLAGSHAWRAMPAALSERTTSVATTSLPMPGRPCTTTRAESPSRRALVTSSMRRCQPTRQVSLGTGMRMSLAERLRSTSTRPALSFSSGNVRPQGSSAAAGSA
mmetsp:Transcript_7891/g.33207  ORF Transcript_7891/g.33207 Transcript_7891/m.33207 type:complete len:315 (-) Transcript_7891:1307-2251(-)